MMMWDVKKLFSVFRWRTRHIRLSSIFVCLHAVRIWFLCMSMFSFLLLHDKWFFLFLFPFHPFLFEFSSSSLSFFVPLIFSFFLLLFFPFSDLPVPLFSHLLPSSFLLSFLPPSPSLLCFLLHAACEVSPPLLVEVFKLQLTSEEMRRLTTEDMWVTSVCFFMCEYKKQTKSFSSILPLGSTQGKLVRKHKKHQITQTIHSQTNKWKYKIFSCENKINPQRTNFLSFVWSVKV